jgi:hypothetical protein
MVCKLNPELSKDVEIDKNLSKDEIPFAVLAIPKTNTIEEKNKWVTSIRLHFKDEEVESIKSQLKTINEETNLIENKPVVKLHHNLNKGVQMYEIEMDNGDILKITGNHKVKLIDGSWRKVEDLKEEDEILYINEKIESHEFDNSGEEHNI